MTKDTSEIAKLTERISKDPKSKLFVPLAEEYKKIGDIEMAIHVLSEGLKINPGYLTARSFLGRLLLEHGDFAASQSEFEEVVKAIPDNLLAHRKLGDLNLLQKRYEDALKHYKIVLTLNPGDAEIASIISEIESEMIPKAKVVQQKPQTSLDQETPSPPHLLKSSAGTSPPLSPLPNALAAAEVTTSEASSEGSPGVSPLLAGNESTVKKSEAEQMNESVLLNEQFPTMAQQSTAPVVDQEEAEDVFVVEPIDDDKAPVPAPAASDIDVFSENVFETNPAEEQTDAIPASSRTVLEEQVIEEAKTEQTIIPDSNALIGEGSEPVILGDEQSFDQTGTDDFTTDTLAELYIAQGFFEKAIDIYQRMLTDNPNSRGLKDKLERVRAKAVSTSEVEFTNATIDKTAPDSTEEKILFAEPKEYVPPIEEGQGEEVTINSELYVEPKNDLTQSPEQAKDAEIAFFGEPQEYRPANEPEEWAGPPSGYKSVDEIFMPPQEETPKTIPKNIDFEPSEYIPPTTEQLPKEEGTPHTPPASDIATHKATIDRLEHWLSNIKKEK